MPCTICCPTSISHPLLLSPSTQDVPFQVLQRPPPLWSARDPPTPHTHTHPPPIPPPAHTPTHPPAHPTTTTIIIVTPHPPNNTPLRTLSMMCTVAGPSFLSAAKTLAVFATPFMETEPSAPLRNGMGHPGTTGVMLRLKRVCLEMGGAALFMPGPACLCLQRPEPSAPL